VARAFGKEPKNVVRDVRNLECSDKFRRLNFELREEIQRHKTGATKSQFYEMTRDGFMFLVMGFTGEPAAEIKEAFIAEFNRMETELNARRLTVREEGRRVRNNFTSVLSTHDVEQPKSYARITNTTYQQLWGMTAAQLRDAHGLPAKANIRDHASEIGLAAIMLSEALSSNRIIEGNLRGEERCNAAVEQCAGYVKTAIVDERKSRRQISSPGL
jgi:Rha family phage regulatory protein